METQKMKIAIVILNWNGKELLERFLPKLIKFSKESNIFVVDNNSTDNSIEFLNTHYSNIDIIINNSNLGYAEGYNIALQKMPSKVLFAKRPLLKPVSSSFLFTFICIFAKPAFIIIIIILFIR